MPPCKNLKPVAEHDFETVSSETIYIGKIFALRVDDVRMPHGNIAKREVVEHFGAVAVLRALGGSDPLPFRAPRPRASAPCGHRGFVGSATPLLFHFHTTKRSGVRPVFLMPCTSHGAAYCMSPARAGVSRPSLLDQWDAELARHGA